MTIRSKRIGAAAAALCLGAGSAAQAINIDNADIEVGTGSGAGELFFSIIDTSRSESFILDLNVPVAGFVADPASFAGAVSVTSSALAGWIAGGDRSAMSWNIAGVNNEPALDTFFTVSTVDPDNAFILPPDVSNVDLALRSAGQYVGQANVDLISDPSGDYGIYGIDDGLAYMFGGAWGFTWGGNYAFDNAMEEGEVSPLWIVNAGLEASQLTENFWALDFDSGTVSYNVIPVPAAVWLFGSALGALGAMRRRFAR